MGVIRVIFWGTPQFAVPSLQRLILEPNVEVLGVVTQPDKRRGRGSKVIPSPIKALAVEHNLPVWQPERANKDQALHAELNALNVDAFIVVAYGQILSSKILKIPPLGAINSHASRLPQYRGAAPIQWAIYDGQPITGVTTMQMNKGMDTGDILLMSQTDIDPLMTTQQLADCLAAHSADLLVQTLHKLTDNSLQPIPQNPAEATYARLITKADYAVDWSRSAIEIHNQVRAFSPNCTAVFREQSLKIITTIPLDAHYIENVVPSLHALFSTLESLPSSGHNPGQIVHLVKKWGPIIATGQGYLLLKTVQLAGRKRQSGQDFTNGLRITVGEQLENGQTETEGRDGRFKQTA